MSRAIETFRRAELEHRIEEAIALLDLLDDDPDLENGHDDEPTLGAENDYMCRSQEFWGQRTRLDECEFEDEHGGDILNEPHDGEGDEEPSLGWLDRMDQRQGLEGHGALCGMDGEPDLGWSGHGTGWRDGDDPCPLEGSERTEDDWPLRSPEDAARRSLGVDPSLLPDEFNCACEGDCLEPFVADGARLHFDKRLPVQSGQLVLIVRKPGMYPKGDHQAVVKRLVADSRGKPYLLWPEGGVVAEMLNPRRTLFYPAHTVMALIACTGPATEPVGPKLTAGDMLARRAEYLAQGRRAC